MSGGVGFLTSERFHTLSFFLPWNWVAGSGAKQGMAYIRYPPRGAGGAVFMRLVRCTFRLNDLAAL